MVYQIKILFNEAPYKMSKENPLVLSQYVSQNKLSEFEQLWSIRPSAIGITLVI